MRAFNLIPADERGGAGVSAGKSGGGAFVVLGLLGVLAIFALLYGQASRQISSQTRQDRDAQHPGAGGPGAGRQARALRQLHDDARTARAGGRPARRLALRLGPRLPRTRPRAAPGQVSLTSLTGTIGSSSGSTAAGADTAAGASSKAAAATGATTPAAGSSSAATASSSSVSSATPAGSVPTFTLAGCATSQAMVALTLDAAASDRRGQRSHAAELRPGGQDRRRRQ